MGWTVLFGVYKYGDPTGMSGIECILDGVSKGTQANGKAEFYVTTRSHTYEVVIPSGWHFVDGTMTFYPFVTESGSFDIIVGWPEDDPYSPWEIVILIEEDEPEPPPDGEDGKSSLLKIGAAAGAVAIAGVLLAKRKR